MRLKEDLAELARELILRTEFTPLEAVERLLGLVPPAQLDGPLCCVGQREHLAGPVPCSPGRLGALEDRAERSGRILLQAPDPDRHERPAPVEEAADLVGQLQRAASEDRRLPVAAEVEVRATLRVQGLDHHVGEVEPLGDRQRALGQRDRGLLRAGPAQAWASFAHSRAATSSSASPSASSARSIRSTASARRPCGRRTS